MSLGYMLERMLGSICVSNALFACLVAQPTLAPPSCLQGLMRLFAERKEVWAAAVDCTAQLDALMSLAVAASCSGGPMCCPKLVPWSPEGGSTCDGLLG